MQCPTPDTVSSSPWWGKEEQTASVYIPLMTRIEVSYNSGIPASEGNLASCVQADDSSNMSSIMSD